MGYEVKVLSDPLPYAKIGTLFQDTYIKPFYDTGALNWSKEYAEWFLHSFYQDKTFFYSTWVGDELVGTLFGNPCKLILDNTVELKALCLSLAATHPEHRKQGLQQRLIRECIEKAKALGFDVVYAIPEKKKGGSLLKKYFEFTCFQKKDKHRVKLMEAYGIKTFKEKRGLNPLIAKLASIYAKIPEDKIERGTIREGSDADMDAILAILNAYRKWLPISMEFSKQELEYHFKTYFTKINDLGPHFGAEWKVWERDNEVIATLLIRYEFALFKNGPAPVALIWHLGYKEGVSNEEKNAFLAEMLQHIRKTYPEVAICQTTMGENEMQVYNNLKFADDLTNYELWMHPLTTKGEEIHRHPKYKGFYIPYYR